MLMLYVQKIILLFPELCDIGKLVNSTIYRPIKSHHVIYGSILLFSRLARAYRHYFIPAQGPCSHTHTFILTTEGQIYRGNERNDCYVKRRLQAFNCAMNDVLQFNQAVYRAAIIDVYIKVFIAQYIQEKYPFNLHTSIF